jgi:hypothetical protein
MKLSRRAQKALSIGAAWSALALILACGGGSDEGDDPVGTGAQTTAPAAGGSGQAIALEPGFVPDPHTVTGTTTPTVQNDHGPDCNGQIPASPNFSLTNAAAFANLRILAQSDTDLVLAVQLSNGTWLCNDDAGQPGFGLNPLVAGAVPSGTHQIYVGTYGGSPANFTLGISELPTVTAQTLGGGAAPMGAGPTGVAPTAALPTSPPAPVSISPGFAPDPMIVRGPAGGPLPASSLDPGCRGFVNQAAPQVVNLTAPMPGLRMMVNTADGTDTTLVVLGPDGQYRCSDDEGDGFDPMLTGPFPAGSYQVWVGTYAAAAAGAPAMLGMTALPNITSDSLQ